MNSENYRKYQLDRVDSISKDILSSFTDRDMLRVNESVEVVESLVGTLAEARIFLLMRELLPVFTRNVKLALLWFARTTEIIDQFTQTPLSKYLTYAFILNKAQSRLVFGDNTHINDENQGFLTIDLFQNFVKKKNALTGGEVFSPETAEDVIGSLMYVEVTAMQEAGVSQVVQEYFLEEVYEVIRELIIQAFMYLDDE